MPRDGVEQLLVFGVGVERFAVALSAVDEVIDMPQVHPIPDAPAWVLGLASIRASLVMLYDPRPLLNLEGMERDAALLFVRRDDALGEDRRIGLVVDALFDPITVAAEDIQAAPGAASADNMIVGVVRQGTDLVAILDVDVLLNRLRTDAIDVKAQALTGGAR